MVKIFEGKLNGKGLKIAIVVSKFNEAITKNLLDGALRGLAHCAVKKEDIEVYKIPGAFEFSFILKEVLSKKKYDGLICLGCLVRGKTSHFYLIAEQMARTIAQTNSSQGTPCAFGVLACNTTKDAKNRSGPNEENYGWKAALTAVEMANLKKQIK